MGQAIETAEFIYYTAGVSTYTPDGNYILGGRSHLEGLLFAAGDCGAGLSGAGGIGLTLAEMASRPPAGCSLLDKAELEAFAVDRFGSDLDPYTQAYREKCGRARGRKFRGGAREP